MLVDVYNVKTEGYTANVNFVVVHVRTVTRSFVPILLSQLTGDYDETITGLIATDVTFRGRVRLRRVSQVAALQ